MKQDEFVAQVQELLEINDVQNRIKELSRKAYNSGAIDVSNLKAGDFRTAKATLSAIFQELSWQHKPFTDEGKETVKNLTNFL